MWNSSINPFHLSSALDVRVYSKPVNLKEGTFVNHAQDDMIHGGQKSRNKKEEREIRIFEIWVLSPIFSLKQIKLLDISSIYISEPIF